MFVRYKKAFFIIIAVAILVAIAVAVFNQLETQSKRLQNLPEATPITTPSAKTKTELPAITTIATKLEIPWSITFLPDKSIIFTERLGRIRFIDQNGVLDSKPLLELGDSYHSGEGGLLGVTVHPDFEKNNLVYFYYTYKEKGKILNRVVRFTFKKRSFSDRKIIIENIPGNLFHNGGRIKFGPDGFLYITTGDAQNESFAQDKNSLAGKILRLKDDGSVPKDNPFRNAVYSYGHRNPQGLAWDDKNRLWETEHGRSGLKSGLDELNLIEKGKNYGWPIIQGSEQTLGMETPIVNSGSNITWAPSGSAFYKGSIFFAGLRGITLYEAIIKNKAAILKEHFKGKFGRLRDVVVSPDGFLYVLTSNRDGRGSPVAADDQIFRINPDKINITE